MSHCGPLTANVLGLKISLRICTPLLAPPPVSFTSKRSSQSLYFFLLHRKVLNLRPFGADPTRAPCLYDQYSSSPSQPASSGPMKPPLSPATAGPAAGTASAPARSSDHVIQRMMLSRKVGQGCMSPGG